MSLYRQPGRAATRTVVIAAGVALVVGLVAGLLIGRATQDEPTLAESVADLRAQLQPAREGLEILPTEYAESVRGGKVVAAPEYEGAKGAVARAKQAVDDARADLRAYDASRADELQRAVAGLQTLVARRVAAAEVERAARAASAALAAATGQTAP